MNPLLIAAMFTITSGAADVEIERAITLDEVPLPARTVIIAEAGDHTIREIEEVTLEDGIVYEAEWIEDGMEVEIVVNPRGKIVSREVEEPDGEVDGDGNGGDDDDDDDGDRDD